MLIFDGFLKNKGAIWFLYEIKMLFLCLFSALEAFPLLGKAQKISRIIKLLAQAA